MQKPLFFYTSVASALTAIATPAAVAQDTDSSATDGSSLAEVIVTAQRFQESAQEIALAIEVIGADELQGVADVRQLQTVTPGVSLSAAGNVVQTYIRGIGSQNATNQQEAAVAYSVDGVYLSTTTMISPLLFDLQRVEVLKGPQGTLYGRNASGGAVNLITNGASLGEFEGYVEAEAGDYDLRRFTGAVNIPVSDTFAVRIAGQDVAHDGYLSDGTDDQDLRAARLRALWEPSSAVTMQVGLDASWIDANGAGSSLNPNPTGDEWIGGTDPAAQAAFPLHSLPPNRPPSLESDQWGAHVQLDADLGFATLTVLPAYRDEELDSNSYVPGYDYGEINHTKQRTFEVRLANRTDALRWVVGAYYYKSEQDLDSAVRFDAIASSTLASVEAETEASAVFGEGTFSLTDSFRIIAGARYTEEESSLEGQNNALAYVTAGVPNTPAFNPFHPFLNPTGQLGDFAVDSTASGDAVTWKAGFELDLAPDSLLFATASRGFKGGGNYFDAAGLDSTFEPEFVTAYELGSRNRFFDGQLQFNAEVFYWEIEDQQIPYVGFNSIPSPVFLTANAGEATMYGVNIDVTWHPRPNDTLRVAVENLQAEYDSFVRETPTFSVLGFPFAPTTNCSVTGYDPLNPFGTANTDCSGLEMLRAPEWTGLASYQHVFDLPGGGDLTFETDVTFASDRYLFISFTDETHDDGYELLNGSLTFNSPGGTYALSAWVHNITEERVMTGGGQNFPGFFRPTLLPPRTAGVSFRYSF